VVQYKNLVRPTQEVFLVEARALNNFPLHHQPVLTGRPGHSSNAALRFQHGRNLLPVHENDRYLLLPPLLSQLLRIPPWCRQHGTCHQRKRVEWRPPRKSWWVNDDHQWVSRRGERRVACMPRLVARTTQKLV